MMPKMIWKVAVLAGLVRYNMSSIPARLAILLLLINALLGCALIPQWYDSPIPVYVDLGNSAPVAKDTALTTTPATPPKTAITH